MQRSPPPNGSWQLDVASETQLASHAVVQHCGWSPSQMPLTSMSASSSQPSTSAAPTVHGEWAQPPPEEELSQTLAVQLPDGQTLSQLPQLEGSLVVSVQPVGQEVWPPVHEPVELLHMLFVQLPAPHALPQAPQLFGSAVMSVQTPPQEICAPEQPPVPVPVPQAPALQPPDGQTLPQNPQLFGSVRVLVQTPPQVVSGAEHVEAPLLPSRKTGPPPASPKGPPLPVTVTDPGGIDPSRPSAVVAPVAHPDVAASAAQAKSNAR